VAEKKNDIFFLVSNRPVVSESHWLGLVYYFLCALLCPPTDDAPHVTPFSVLKDLMYADSHEWVKVEGDSATVGITDYAQVSTFIYFYCCEFRV
jgi:hypothetical protein